MIQLEGSENRISTERRRYIEDVNDYNKKVTSFPNNLTAGVMGFHRIANYQAQDGADVTPNVNLGD
jgi:LemA protein